MTVIVKVKDHATVVLNVKVQVQAGNPAKAKKAKAGANFKGKAPAKGQAQVKRNGLTEGTQCVQDLPQSTVWQELAARPVMRP